MQQNHADFFIIYREFLFDIKIYLLDFQRKKGYNRSNLYSGHAANMESFHDIDSQEEETDDKGKDKYDHVV